MREELISIVFVDEESTESMFKEIIGWTSTNYTDNNWGLNWLGNIIGNGGFDINLPCRGWISCMSVSRADKRIQIETVSMDETDAVEIIKEVVRRECPSATIN